MIARLALGFILAHLGAAPLTAQSCAGDGLMAEQIGLDRYDPTSQERAVIRIAIRLPQPCLLESLALVPRTEATFIVRGAGGVLNARQIVSPDLIVANPSRATLDDEALERLGGGETVVFELLDFPARQFVQAGSYGLDLDLVVRDRSVALLPLVVQVEPAVQFLNEAATGSIDVDLGNVENGAREERTLYFRSNTRLSLRVASEHGALQHENGAQFGRIPYDVTVNGEPLAGASAVQRLSNAPGDMLSARVAVAVAPVRSAFAGNYSDILTFNLIAD